VRMLPLPESKDVIASFCLSESARAFDDDGYRGEAGGHQDLDVWGRMGAGRMGLCR
jgi:hypothetical protein